MLVLGLGELWIIILTANRGANGAGELSVLASTDEWMSCWDAHPRDRVYLGDTVDGLLGP